MPKSKPQQPILKLVPPSPWLQKTVNGVPYWVHVPSRRGGIHIRGLARLCGVHISTLQNAIKQGQKVGAEVTENYRTDLHILLKDKIIFLEKLTEISPEQQGGPVKVICANVCADLIHYYAMKGKIEAVKSLGLFLAFGIEQYIFIKVGFIPTPESVTIDNIDYLIAKETVQVNKSRQEEAQFFTNPRTGECGIDIKSLTFLCGGVAIKHVESFVEAQNEPFLQPQQSEKIVKATVCAATLQYFGEVHKPRKTLAQYWSKALEPIVPTLHQKTHYQAAPKTDRETQLEMKVHEQAQQIARLEQLVQTYEVQGKIQWHRVLAQVLQPSIPNNFFHMQTEIETTQVTQRLDLLIIQRQNPLPRDFVLPDGLILDREINLVTYKSHQESLDVWAIQELVGHYCGYRKVLAKQRNDKSLPPAESFQLYAVAAMYPQGLAAYAGANWQATEQTGVYRLLGFGSTIIVIVASQIPAAPHNLPWNLLSCDPELIRYALALSPLPEDLRRYFEPTLIS